MLLPFLYVLMCDYKQIHVWQFYDRKSHIMPLFSRAERTASNLIEGGFLRTKLSRRRAATACYAALCVMALS
ncbi:hypothetical protein BH18ACI2_BH18ACI2_27320 [soil metagenome]